VVVAMYMRAPGAEQEPWARFQPGAVLALGVSAALVLGLGVYPAPLLRLARLAAAALQ